MPNIAAALKNEIVRLARKEIRNEAEGFKKASKQFRTEIAALKSRVAGLEKQQGRAEKKVAMKSTLAAEGAEPSRLRFSSKGFASLRQKLGISAADMGLLLGVSAQSVYHWESGKTQPRRSQLIAIAALRNLGKREVKAQLALMAKAPVENA